jgi:hypothetical protein
MAIAVDKSSLFTPVVAASTGTTIAGTTNVAVVSGGFIVMVVVTSGLTAAQLATATMAGGGLTWTRDHTMVRPTTSYGIAVFSAQAPSGLASGTTITATVTSCPERNICGFSFTGVATSSAHDQHQGSSGSATTAWTSGATPNTTGAGMAIGVSTSNFGSAMTETPAAGWAEFSGAAGHFTSSGGSSTCCVVRYDVATATPYTASGTWSGSGGVVGIVATYKEAAVAAAGNPMRMVI